MAKKKATKKKVTKKKVVKTSTEATLDRIVEEKSFSKASGNTNRAIQRRCRAALALLRSAFELAQEAGLDRDHVYGRPTVQLNNAILRADAAEDGFRDLP
jgi:hypothetical protein